MTYSVLLLLLLLVNVSKQIDDQFLNNVSAICVCI